MDLSSAITQWQTLLGDAAVTVDNAVCERYGCDTSGVPRHVAGVLQITDSALLPQVMRIAMHCQVSIYPISTGNNWGYGSAQPARDGCIVLDLSGLRKILDFDEEMGVVTLEPGVTQAMLAEFLDEGDHPYLVPVTGAGPSCSLMGNALERGYGVTPQVDHFAAVTDLEAVLPDGSLYRTALNEIGGADLARLFKWGIGPYSTGLFTQSGFGVVTRMSIVLSRRPECVKVCLFSLREEDLLEPAIQAIRSILIALPGTVQAINLMNQLRVLSMSAPYPADKVGSDGLIPAAVIEELGRRYHVLPWTGFATLYGTRRVVEAAQKEIRAALAGIATRLLFVSPQRAGTLSTLAQLLPGATGKRLASLASTLAQSLQLVDGRPNETAMPLVYWRTPVAPKGPLKNPTRDGCGLVWYAPLVPMRPAGVKAYVEMVKRVTRAHSIEPLITFTSINDRLFDSTVPLLFDKTHPGAIAGAQACYLDLLESGRLGGWFPYRVGVHAMPVLADLQLHSGVFHRRLSKDLDPLGLMAPGRYQ